MKVHIDFLKERGISDFDYWQLEPQVDENGFLSLSHAEAMDYGVLAILTSEEIRKMYEQD